LIIDQVIVNLFDFLAATSAIEKRDKFTIIAFIVKWVCIVLEGFLIKML